MTFVPTLLSLKLKISIYKFCKVLGIKECVKLYCSAWFKASEPLQCVSKVQSTPFLNQNGTIVYPKVKIKMGRVFAL